MSARYHARRIGSMSKKTIWLIGGVVAVLVWAAWRTGTYPAQLIVMNQSGGPLRGVVVSSGGQRVEIGELRNGASRVIRLKPGEPIVLTYGGKRWQSPEPLPPARGTVLFIGGDFIELQRAGRE